MKKIQILPETKIRYVGLFDFEGLYKDIKKWLDFYGYGNEKGGKFKEVKFTERKKGESKQIEIEWIAKKGVSSYFTNVITIKFLVIGLTKVEATKDNKKFRTSQGEINLFIESYIEMGFEKEVGILKDIYQKIIVRRRTEEYKKDLYDKTISLTNYIKEYLGLRT